MKINDQVFSWKRLKVGIFKGMMGRVYLIQWGDDKHMTLCLPSDFDIPFRI